MPVSPYMEKAFGYHGFRRYVAFTRTRFGFLYWMDGIEDGLSVVAIWDRFLNHPLIHPHLGDCRLKARTVDPEELTMFASPAEALRIELEELGDAILLDREKRVVWIGLLARVFLHLALAIAYEELPAANEEDADIPQTVDAAPQRKLLYWLDRRLKAASRVADMKCR